MNKVMETKNTIFNNEEILDSIEDIEEIQPEDVEEAQIEFEDEPVIEDIDEAIQPEDPDDVIDIVTDSFIKYLC